MRPLRRTSLAAVLIGVAVLLPTVVASNRFESRKPNAPSFTTRLSIGTLAGRLRAWP
jgi:hypothetical protein